MAPFFWFFSVSFASKTFPLCWLRKRIDFKLGCQKDDNDKDNKIDKGDAYKVDIDNEITWINTFVMVRDGKRGLRGFYWWWRCLETRDRAKKREEKRENDEREKVEKGKKFTTVKWKEKKGGIKRKRNVWKGMKVRFIKENNIESSVSFKPTGQCRTAQRYGCRSVHRELRTQKKEKENFKKYRKKMKKKRKEKKNDEKKRERLLRQGIFVTLHLYSSPSYKVLKNYKRKRSSRHNISLSVF